MPHSKPLYADWDQNKTDETSTTSISLTEYIAEAAMDQEEPTETETEEETETEAEEYEEEEDYEEYDDDEYED